MRRWFWHTAFVFLLGFSAHAQQTDTLTLDETLVTDYRIEANKSFKETTIHTDSLRKVAGFSLAEALSQNTSIFVKSYGANGISSLSLRGTGASHTNVYWNNLDIGNPGLGQADLSILPANAFDQVQLQYGFASLSEGSGGLGGSVRLNNRPHFGKKSSLRLSQLVGSFGKWQSSASLETGKGRLRSQSGIYYYTTQNNFKYPDITTPGWPEKELQNANTEQFGAYQNLYYRLGKSQMMSFKAWYNQVDRNLPPPITGDPSGHDAMLDRTLAAVAEYQSDRSQNHILINSGLVRAANIFTNGGDSVSSNNNFISWQNNFRNQKQISHRIQLEYGAHYRIEQAQSEAYNTSITRHRAHVFGELTYAFSKKWTAMALLREEYISTVFSPLLASLGATYKWQPNVTFRVNLAHNYRYPSLNDLYWNPGGNPNLKPEDGYSIEGGWTHRVSFSQHNQITYSVTAFYNSVDDWIQWVPTGLYWSPQNIKKVENAGLEIDASAQQKLFGKLQFTQQLHYTYTRALTTITYGNIGEAYLKQLIYVPYHKVVLGLGMRYNNWEIRYGQQITGKYFISADNETFMPAYTIAQFSVIQNNILKNKKHLLQLALRINNIYDMPYQVMPYRPEPGIHYTLQLTYNPNF